MNPPANTEAEAALLGALLIENSLIDSAADRLSSADFAEPVHGRVFDAIVQLASAGKYASAVSLRPYMEGDPHLEELGGMAYIARLSADGQGLLAPRELADQIAELAQRRRMQAGLQQAALDCADPTLTTAEIVSQADAAFSSVEIGSMVEMSAGDCVNALIQSFGEPRQGVTCGAISCLDDLLGPMRPKQLVIGAGRPGMGKTALALSYGLGAARNGHGVLYVSLEMSGTELGQRVLADQCYDGQDGVQFNAIRDGRPNEWQRRRVNEVAQEIADLPFKIIDTGSLTLGRLNMLVRRTARRMAAKGQKLELVIVDYLQLLRADRKVSRYEEITEISMALKALAKDQNVAIFALAQLSREVEKRHDKRPQLSDLRDSGQIEQDADAVLFLYRAEYYLRQAENEYTGDKRADWEAALHKVAGLIEFNVAKRRNGETGSATGRFLGAYQAVRG